MTVSKLSLPLLAPLNPCRTCSRCCRSYAVPVNGQDVWRIWRSQRLAPETFVVPLQITNERPDAFKLHAGDNPLLLILDKQGKLKPDAPCVFLLQLPGGHDRCAIYQDRPAACRAYPMQPAPGGIAINPKALCPPNSWSDEHTSSSSWRITVLQADLAYDVYSMVVAHWNGRVEQFPERQFTLTEFFSFLFNVYERIAALDQLLDERQWQAVRETWGLEPDDHTSPAPLPWMDYVEQIQHILGSFYPDTNSNLTRD